MFKNNDKCNNTETAIKLLNKYADSYYQLEQQIKLLKKENNDLHQNILINKEIIQNFLKNHLLIKKLIVSLKKLSKKIQFS